MTLPDRHPGKTPLGTRVSPPTVLQGELEQLIVADLPGPAGGADETVPGVECVRDRYLAGLAVPTAAGPECQDGPGSDSDSEGGDSDPLIARHLTLAQPRQDQHTRCPYQALTGQVCRPRGRRVSRSWSMRASGDHPLRPKPRDLLRIEAHRREDLVSVLAKKWGAVADSHMAFGHPYRAVDDGREARHAGMFDARKHLATGDVRIDKDVGSRVHWPTWHKPAEKILNLSC